MLPTAEGVPGAPCWRLEQYDEFNVEQAEAYYSWAATDPRIVGINIRPWSGYLPPASYQGCNVGLKALPKARAAWEAIGRRIIR